MDKLRVRINVLKKKKKNVGLTVLQITYSQVASCKHNVTDERKKQVYVQRNL